MISAELRAGCKTPVSIAFVGGIVIGLVQSLTLLLLPLQLQNVGVFVAFLIVLYVRPQGLFGRRARTV